MKLCSRKALPSASLLQNVNISSTVARIQGSTKKLGEQYNHALIVLYNRVNMQPIAARKPDINGIYKFLGLDTNLKTFIIAFDQKKKYNAVIQDSVVPK